MNYNIRDVAMLLPRLVRESWKFDFAFWNGKVDEGQYRHHGKVGEQRCVYRSLRKRSRADACVPKQCRK